MCTLSYPASVFVNLPLAAPENQYSQGYLQIQVEQWNHLMHASKHGQGKAGSTLPFGSHSAKKYPFPHLKWPLSVVL